MDLQGCILCIPLFLKKFTPLFACVYRAIKRSDCFHADGDSAPCHVSNIIYMVFFGIVQVILSQIPDFDRIWWLSIVAAIMSFSYSTIGLGLGLGKASGMETHPSPQLHICMDPFVSHVSSLMRFVSCV
jgi:hypothetical protein